jgi:hypothetical protein
MKSTLIIGIGSGQPWYLYLRPMSVPPNTARQINFALPHIPLGSLMLRHHNTRQKQGGWVSSTCSGPCINGFEPTSLIKSKQNINSPIENLIKSTLIILCREWRPWCIRIYDPWLSWGAGDSAHYPYHCRQGKAGKWAIYTCCTCLAGFEPT